MQIGRIRGCSIACGYEKLYKSSNSDNKKDNNSTEALHISRSSSYFSRHDAKDSGRAVRVPAEPNAPGQLNFVPCSRRSFALATNATNCFLQIALKPQ